jgi:transcriptional regulator with XRE-family HTH domain
MAKQISNPLIAARETLDLSQYRVAKDTGIPRSTYRRIELGINTPNQKHARALFDYYRDKDPKLFPEKRDIGLIYDPLFVIEARRAQ